jgi:plasmid stabilization system protein ParE
MGRVYWPDAVLDLLADLRDKERDLIFEKTERLAEFPRMYPMRSKGRFRNHRWCVAANWIVYYRTDGPDVYIRAIWPARIP